MIYNSITNDALNELPLQHFQGEIVVVEDVIDIPAVLNELKKYAIVGFDTETKPAFKKGQSNEIALLQLSTDKETYLIRLNKTGIPPILADYLASDQYLKVGVGIRDDIRGLQRMANFTADGFVELQTMATDKGLKDFSLKKLAGILLKFRVSKRQRLSNWETEVLSEGQIIYAATDSWVALEIYKKLQEINPVNVHELPEAE